MLPDTAIALPCLAPSQLHTNTHQHHSPTPLGPASSPLPPLQVPDLLCLQAAAAKSLTAESRVAMTTQSLHSELVYNMSGSKHVGGAAGRGDGAGLVGGYRAHSSAYACGCGTGAHLGGIGTVQA